MGMHGDIRWDNSLKLHNESVHCTTLRRLNENCGLLIMKRYTATSRISVFQNSCHVFNCDCGFTHMSQIQINFSDVLILQY